MTQEKKYEYDRIYQIPITDILIDETNNCRGKIAPHTLTGLAHDIEDNGLHQPVILRIEKGQLILVAGFRRTFAHKLIGKTHIDGIVRNISPLDAMIINFSENVQREELNMLQEAHALARMLRVGLTPADIAKRIQKSQGWVRTRAMLLRLPPDLQELAGSGVLSPQNVLDLIAIKDPEEQRLSAIAIKQKRDRGYSGPVKVKIETKSKEVTKKQKASKVARTRNEIFNFIDYLVKIGYPMGLHTRCLSWAAGEISDTEILRDIEGLCLAQDLDFAMPMDLIIPDMKAIPTDV